MKKVNGQVPLDHFGQPDIDGGGGGGRARERWRDGVVDLW
jgi:hypothetical protein